MAAFRPTLNSLSQLSKLNVLELLLGGCCRRAVYWRRGGALRGVLDGLASGTPALSQVHRRSETKKRSAVALIPYSTDAVAPYANSQEVSRRKLEPPSRTVLSLPG